MVDRQNFIGSLLPYAMEASKRTGIDPRIIIAQGALESNWGKSAPGNNYFGIKSHGQSGGNALATTEVVNGQPVRVNDSFRSYQNPGDSVMGYADFISSNPRYEKFRSAQGLDNQIAELGRSGYATDPNYASKISSIAGSINVDKNVSPDGPKGQESYKPVMGSMMASNTYNNMPAERPVVNAGNADYVTPPDDVPDAARKIAGVSAPRGIADIFSLMALQGAQQPTPQVQQVQGPSPQQAQALLNALRSLNGRQV